MSASHAGEAGRRVWQGRGVVPAASAEVYAVVSRAVAPDARFDLPRQRITIEGAWWCQGVIAVQDDLAGSAVVSEVFNRAQRGRPLAALLVLQRQLDGTFRRGLLDLLRAVSADFGTGYTLT